MKVSVTRQAEPARAASCGRAPRLRDDDPLTAGLADPEFFAQRPERAFRLTTALPLELARWAGSALPHGAVSVRMAKRDRRGAMVAFFGAPPSGVSTLNAASNAELADVWRRVARCDLVARADPAPRHQCSLHEGGNC